MQKPEDCIAVLFSFRYHADGKEIVNLIDWDSMRIELLLDRIEPLNARFDTRVNVSVVELCFDCAYNPIKKSFALAAECVDLSSELGVGMRVHVTEGEIFELSSQLAHAQAMRERSVDVQGLFGDALLLLKAEVFERSHVVESICELNDDDSNVCDHREQHLADVLSLMIFAVCEFDFVQLGDTFDDMSDLLPEPVSNLLSGNIGVLNGVVQKTSCDRRRIHLQIGEYLGDLKRMNDVGFAGGAELALMLFLTESPRSADEIEVIVGPIRTYGSENMLETSAEIFAEGCSKGGFGGR